MSATAKDAGRPAASVVVVAGGGGKVALPPLVPFLGGRGKNTGNNPRDTRKRGMASMEGKLVGVREGGFEDEGANGVGVDDGRRGALSWSHIDARFVR